MFYVSNDKSTLKFQIFGHKSSFRNEKFHITLIFEQIFCIFLYPLFIFGTFHPKKINMV